MHNLKHSQQKNKGLTFSPYKLGLDIVVEAYLLARTNYFIHGFSNVSNFVLSLNDRLDSFYVYADAEVTDKLVDDFSPDLWHSQIDGFEPVAVGPICAGMAQTLMFLPLYCKLPLLDYNRGLTHSKCIRAHCQCSSKNAV